ncbi:MAG: prepilin-type N-terminal cleavage/methylation domain-containing protein [Verrucomicrobia bacterium]|nr:prepilin-type N-terminal cleavage/methylation domain-containing protein [Verrucomicrobiota bacterium]
MINRQQRGQDPNGGNLVAGAFPAGPGRRRAGGAARVGQAAFSLVEVLVAVSIVGVLFVTMYVGITSGFGVVQVARENQRATQILLEKMETIRLYSWDQLSTPGFIPASFSSSFYTTNGVGTGILYTGSVAIAAAPITESYSNDLVQVTVQIGWMSGNVARSRSMSTFVSRYGLQNYIY